MSKKIDSTKDQSNKYIILLVLVIITIFTSWFYWTKIRVERIRKACYSEAFRKNELNFEWAEGKEWKYLAAFANGPHGWVYPDYLIARATIYDAAKLMRKDEYDEKAIIVETVDKVKKMREEVYKQCLVRQGVSTSL